MLYLKLVPNEFKNQNRDKRELAVARKLGYSVFVIATTKESHNFQERFENYDVYQISTRILGDASWLRWLNRGIAFFEYVIQTVCSEADIISGHDYVMLAVAYIANLFKFRKAKLIYDSHEFELGRNANRGKFALRWVKFIEGYLLRRVDLTLMVGDKIADSVKNIYKLNERPTVIRNIPSYWRLDYDLVKNIRTKFLQEMELPDTACLLMYHGYIVHGEGFEQVIRSLPLLPNVGLIIMGDEGSPQIIEYLIRIAKEKNVYRQLLFKPAVPIQELKNYIGAVDIEMIMTSDKVAPSYTYSLPNKFFESIQAGVPMICRNLPELKKIVCEYNIGLLVEDDNEESIAEAVIRLKEDRALYARLKENMAKAKEELCWEKESLKLMDAIRQMVKGRDS